LSYKTTLLISILFFGLYLSYARSEIINWGVAIAISTLLAITLKALGSTLDISITGNTKFIGWILMLFTLWLLLRKNLPPVEDKPFGSSH
jgi:hypothetical protein